MNNLVCFECGSNGPLHFHHPIPRRLGGKKTIPLCEECHGKIHNIDFTNHGILTKKGLDAARARGVKLGFNKNLTQEGRDKGIQVLKNNRVNNEEWKLAKEFIKDYIIKNGNINLSDISRLLNENGYRTRKGCQYTPATVRRLIVQK
jgi:hypothetical protein